MSCPLTQFPRVTCFLSTESRSHMLCYSNPRSQMCFSLNPRVTCCLTQISGVICCFPLNQRVTCGFTQIPVVTCCFRLNPGATCCSTEISGVTISRHTLRSIPKSHMLFQGKSKSHLLSSCPGEFCSSLFWASLALFCLSLSRSWSALRMEGSGADQCLFLRAEVDSDSTFSSSSSFLSVRSSSSFASSSPFWDPLLRDCWWCHSFLMGTTVELGGGSSDWDSRRFTGVDDSEDDVSATPSPFTDEGLDEGNEG